MTSVNLLHGGNVPQPLAQHRLSTTERLVTVPEPLRDAVVRYLHRKRVTCVPSTISGLATRSAHFGRIVTTLNPTLASLADVDCYRHIEPCLIGVGKSVSSRTGLNVIRYVEGFYKSKSCHSRFDYRRPDGVHCGRQQPEA